jgi:hypothetical protein
MYEKVFLVINCELPKSDTRRGPESVGTFLGRGNIHPLGEWLLLGSHPERYTEGHYNGIEPNYRWQPGKESVDVEESGGVGDKLHWLSLIIDKDLYDSYPYNCDELWAISC